MAIARRVGRARLAAAGIASGASNDLDRIRACKRHYAEGCRLQTRRPLQTRRGSQARLRPVWWSSARPDRVRQIRALSRDPHHTLGLVLSC